MFSILLRLGEVRPLRFRSPTSRADLLAWEAVLLIDEVSPVTG